MRLCHCTHEIVEDLLERVVSLSRLAVIPCLIAGRGCSISLFDQ
jgi:hypothetical protein